MLDAATEKGSTQIQQAMFRKLCKADAHLLRLAFEYKHGKPVQRVQVGTPEPLHIILQTGGPAPLIASPHAPPAALPEGEERFVPPAQKRF